MLNIEQGTSIVEGPVNAFKIRHWPFDIQHSKSPFLPFPLSPFLPFSLSPSRLFHLFAIALCWIGLATNARAQQAVPQLSGRVVDEAGILSDPAETRLTALLAAYEDSTTNQVVVLTIPSLEGESIEAFSIRVAETWGLGTEENDNGVLLVVAVEDRGLRLEVGQGLEGELPDVIAGRIIREEIVPYLRQGNYERGIEVGVLAVLEQLEGPAEATEARDFVEAEPEPTAAATPSFWDWWMVIIAVYYLACLVLCCVAAALAMLEKTPGRVLIFVFLLVCFFFISRSLGYFIFWFMSPWLLAVGVAGLFAVLFWRSARRLKSDTAFKVAWQRRLLIHGPDLGTEEDNTKKVEESAAAGTSPYPRRIQIVVLIAFTTQLALYVYTRWLFVIWLVIGAVLTWFSLSRIAEDPARRKRRRATTWTPFGSMPSGSSRSSSGRSSRSSPRSSWSSSSSSSYSSSSSSSYSSSSSSSYSSSSSSSSGSFSGGGGSFGGGGASGSW